MLSGEVNSLRDFKRMAADSGARLPDTASKQGGESSSDNIDAVPEERQSPASQIKVETGIDRCPKCRGHLVGEKDLAGNNWHICERHNNQSGRKCDYRIVCHDPSKCVLTAVVYAPVLEPCRYGHVGAWVLWERRGRCYVLYCRGPGVGHRNWCPQVLTHWRGPKPSFERKPTDNENGYTVFLCLRALLEGDSITVSDVAAISGLSERKARACLKRMSLAATPLVKEMEEKIYDPKSRRYVLEYKLTREGRIVLDYELQYGKFADPTYQENSLEIRRAPKSQATPSEIEDIKISDQTLTKKPESPRIPQLPPIRRRAH